MDDTQLMKGILEGCVLAVISKEETYGYEILQKLSSYGFDELAEGTMYPVLTRLEKKGYVACRKVKSPLGPIRKYYSITELGSEYLDGFRKNYRRVTKCADEILKASDD
ncbi:MAG: PadR family transcriptional regulator [Eubacterium sp.]|nr:PadR family transcriptional regulator [Eubacterium sp.]